ncbi:cob(I)yrinic acid a,c-diamide adenosyltransferase [Termitidicoccus mucosus]|uniref:corrinoid adenosyltransferase n=1 Tax=Termitidicoccus mucosus TaxID=1184151 RepID=A0A178IMI1_9BACT|nr:cob(I)yrinic acid a,c-diamide adenosyltransferase [Opitutaceae bacterium TSB47]
MNDHPQPSSPSPARTDAEHREHMQTVQAQVRAAVQSAKDKRGLVMVHTGNGKGKTTAAFGMLARMLAHKRKCAVIQFIKSGKDAVARLLESPNLHWHHAGGGFTWDTQNRDSDIALCREGWRLALSYFADPEISFIHLDELNVVLDIGYLPKDEVLAALRAKRPDLHVVCTGRNAPPELIELADLVTEMREIKHPFNAGIQAQQGIEF